MRSLFTAGASLLLQSLLLPRISAQAAFIPEARSAHIAQLIGNTIYFAGGNTANVNASPDFFSIDVSREFDAASPPFKDLSDLEGAPSYTSRAFACSAAINNTLWVYGGSLPSANISLGNPDLAAFDTNTNTWKAPASNDTSAPAQRLRDMACALDPKSGLLYIWGGKFNNTLVNTMNIFDTTAGTWVASSSSRGSSPPAARADHTGTLLSDGRIVYIGGTIAAGSDFRLQIYDTKSGSWSSQGTANNVTAGDGFNRTAHSAVLTHDGRIIVLGNDKAISQKPYFAVLDTTTNPMQWSFPQSGSNLPNGIASLALHSATMVGKYMIIAFGAHVYQGYNRINSLSIMDTETYTWKSKFDPTDAYNFTRPTTRSGSTSSESQQSNEPEVAVIVGSVVAGLVFVCAVALSVFLFRRGRRERRLPRPLPYDENGETEHADLEGKQLPKWKAQAHRNSGVEEPLGPRISVVSTEFENTRPTSKEVEASDSKYLTGTDVEQGVRDSGAEYEIEILSNRKEWEGQNGGTEFEIAS